MGAGERIGRYELVSPLGQGGFGSVWEAILHGPRGFRKAVALKRIRSLGALPDSLVEEARLAAWLAHPNVVQVYELFEAGEELVLSMELVRGASAADLARPGPLSGRALQDLGVQAARALVHVHATRIDGASTLVHRDLKPGNLLIDRTGTVKLADFGIARLVGGAQGAPVAGTPGYMAPEQRDGTEGPPADLFALGVTLCALACGRVPFGRGLAAVAAVEDPEGRFARSGLRAELDRVLPGCGAVVGRCLRRDPRDRFPDARELVEALVALQPPPGPSLLDHLAQARPGLELDPSSGRSTGQGRPRATVRGSHPVRADAFVGRAEEQERLRAALGESRLVTLVGPGGAGKTRLAWEVARSTDRPGDGWWCDLERAISTVGMAEEVARVLGIPLHDAADPVRAVGGVLAARGPTWLVLDNLEQGVEAAREVVAAWLSQAPELSVLGTSRVPLHLPQELRVAVGQLEPAAALELFTRRAASSPAPADLPAVVEIVAALDHLPLPIELAAAWTRVLPVSEVRRALSDRFRLLSNGPPDGPERHRSLRACIEGSMWLLSAEDRGALATLSVFEAPFEFRAAERVLPRAAGERWVLDTLASLVDASLLHVEGERFRMLASVRDHVGSLLGAPEREAAERRHGAWFARSWSRAVVAEIDRVEPVAGLQRLAVERADLVAAAWRAVARGDASVAVPTAAAVAFHDDRRGPPGSGRALLEGVVGAFPDSTEARVALAQVALAMSDWSLAERALAGAEGDEEVLLLRASLLRSQERLERSEAAGLAAWRLAEARHSRRWMVEAAYQLGMTCRLAMRFSEAREHLEASLRLARARRDRRAVSRALAGLGSVSIQLGRHEDARAPLEEAVAAAREIGDRRAEASWSTNLGLVECNVGSESRAREVMLAALDLQRALGLRAIEAQTLTNLASLSPIDECIAMLEAARRLHAELGNRRSEAIALGNLGSKVSMKDPEAGRRLVAAALEEHRAMGNSVDVVVMTTTLVEIDLRRGALEDAEERLREVIELARALDLGRPWVRALLHLADLCEARGDRDGERRALVEAHALAVRSGDPRVDQIAERLEARWPDGEA